MSRGGTNPDFEKLLEQLRKMSEAQTPEPPPSSRSRALPPEDLDNDVLDDAPGRPPPKEERQSSAQVQFVDDEPFSKESGGSDSEKVVEQLELIRIRLQQLPREIVEELRSG